MTKKPKKLGVKTDKTKITAVTTSNEELDQVCSTLDRLTLDSLILMEQQIRNKLNVEKTMTDGEMHLTKSRYIMGHKNVSKLQLPSEHSHEFNSNIRLVEENDDKNVPGHLNLIETESESKSEKHDPLKWFGVLVPRDLRAAQSKYKEALSWVVDCANTQIRLQQICANIKRVTQYKEMLQELQNEEE